MSGLSRSRPPAGRLFGLEAGRGIAAIGVVLCHACMILNRTQDAPGGAPAIPAIFLAGHAGVDFFFVLSGFIILFVHAGDIGRPARLGRYGLRRLTRIMPPYWIALLLTMLLGGGIRVGTGSGWDLVAQLLLLPSDRRLLVNMAWTLQYEVAFYALFAILIVSRAAGIAVLLAWLCGILLSLGGWAPALLPRMLVGAYNLDFFLGMAVAYWLRDHDVPAPRRVLAAGVALFALAGAGETLQVLDGSAALTRLAYGSAACVIVLGVVAAERRRLLRVPAALRMLGAASYSIYIFHVIVMSVLWLVCVAAGLDRVLPPAASFLLLATGGVAGGILMARLVEQPLMRLLRGQYRAALPQPVVR